MFLSKDSLLSSRVFGHVLNSPLYDADCSPAAREKLAAGDVEGAIAEWQRLADLGSGRARCVLAFLHFRGTPTIPADFEAAKALARAALSGERGYASYLLGCIALAEHQGKSAVSQFSESAQANFVPAKIMLARLSASSATATEGTKKAAEVVLRRANGQGYGFAGMSLVQLYLRGRFGFLKRCLGLIEYPFGLLRFLLMIRYKMFSVHCVEYIRYPKIPLFNHESILRIQRASTLVAAASHLTATRWLHAIAAAITVVVLVSHPDFSWQQYESHPGWVVAGWIGLAAWPYGFSYILASTLTNAAPIVRLTYSSMLILTAALACDAYNGSLLGVPLSGWIISGISAAHAVLLLTACGLGLRAAEGLTVPSDSVPPYRGRILWAHLILGFVAAASVVARPSIWDLGYLRHFGIDVIARAMTAGLPYGASAAFCWSMVTTRRVRPWVYFGVLILGTAIAVGTYSGAFGWHTDLLSFTGVVMVQLIAYFLAAEWALEEREW